jgi:hypothetical protein
MKQYMQAYMVGGILVTIASIMSILNGIVEPNMQKIVISAALLCLWWFLYDRMQRSKRGSVAFSLVPVGYVWCLLLSYMLSFRAFAVKHNSLEGPNGEGSPLAFLLDLGIIAFFFLIYSAIGWQGLAAILRKKQEPPSADQ